MKFNIGLNIVAFIVFIVAFAIGASEIGYNASMGYNLVQIFVMLFGVLGILTQFILLNISLMIEK